MRIITKPNCFGKENVMGWKCCGCPFSTPCWYNDEEDNHEVGQ